MAPPKKVRVFIGVSTPCLVVLKEHLMEMKWKTTILEVACRNFVEGAGALISPLAAKKVLQGASFEVEML